MTAENSRCRSFRAGDMHGGLVLTVFLVIFAIIAARTARMADRSRSDVERASVMIARHLVPESARPTGASIFDEPAIRAPGYALILASLARLDPELVRGIYCAGDIPWACGDSRPFEIVIIAQALAAMGTMGIIYLLTLTMVASRRTALLTTVLAFVTGHFGVYAGVSRVMIPYQIALLAFLWLSVRAWRSRCIISSIAAGCIAGLLGLLEPTGLFVVPVTAAAIIVVPGVLTIRRRVVMAAALAMSALGVLTAGLLWAISLGYDSDGIIRHITWRINERVAFNQMDGLTRLASLSSQLPALGKLAWLIFPDSVMAKFGNYQPGALVHDGSTSYVFETLRQPGTPVDQLHWVFGHFVLGQSVQYVLSMPTILLEGLWADSGWIGFLGLFQIRTMMRWAEVDGWRGSLCIVLAPVAALLVVHTFVTANPSFLNTGLLYVYALALATVVRGL